MTDEMARGLRRLEPAPGDAAGARRHRRAGERARRRPQPQRRGHDAHRRVRRRARRVGHGQPAARAGVRRCVAVLPVALLQAWLSVTLRANQIVTGIGINILVLGAHDGRLPRDPRPPQSHRDSRPRALVAAGPRRHRRSGARRCSARPGCSMPAWSLVVLAAWVLRDTAVGLAVRAVGVGAARGRQVGPVGHARALRRGPVHRPHVGAGRLLPVDRRHPHLHRRHDQRRRLPGPGGGDLRQLEDRPHGARLPVLRRRDGAAVPAAGAWASNVPTALLIMLPYLMALVAVGGLVGRQTAPPYLTRAYVR